MHSEQNKRISTSALLYDDNEKVLDGISDAQPLLPYTDFDDISKHQLWYRQMLARH
ncbi:unnamed protein product, partial [Rotaria magnacalcarata]